MQKQPVYDSYGFKTNPITLAVQSYLNDNQGQQERISLWENIIKKYFNDVDHKEMKEYQQIIRNQVRKGIPDQLRPKVWMKLIVPPNRQYQTIQIKQELKQIDRDVNRTIPTNKRQTELRQKLKNMLNMLAIVFPEMGYCQGLNFITANLLLILSEKETYNVMYHILYWQEHEKLMSNLDRIHAKLYTLNKLVKKHFPQLASHLEKMQIEPLLYASSWFITLFNNSLPVSYCFRIFQIYFIEGQKVLYRVALQILKQKKKVIKKMNTPQQIISQLKSSDEFNKALIDRFFRNMFEINLSRKEIQSLEKEYENKRQKQ